MIELSFEKEPEVCKGLIFRCRINDYVVGAGYVYSEKFTLLKRKSCYGCSECYWMEDALQEQIHCEIPPLNDPAVDKALYQLKVVDYSTDWESGKCDDFTLGYILLKDEE